MKFYGILLCLVYAVCAEDYYYAPGNVSRATLSGIEAYRSALTLDWLAAEDTRQRELVAAYETEPSAPARIVTTECNDFPKPSTGKVTTLMLELLKNLEGDDGVIVTELIRVLRRSKLMSENTALYSEPDLDSLMKMPEMMMGQPQMTFPRILAIVWILVTDATTTTSNGWCPINKVNEYLVSTKSADIANHLTRMEPVIARARFIMEEFIQSINPSNPRINPNIKPAPTTTEETETLATSPPRTKRKNVLRVDIQDKQLEMSTEYQSTLFLEQAQQFATMPEDFSKSSSHQVKVICIFALAMFAFLF